MKLVWPIAAAWLAMAPELVLAAPPTKPPAPKADPAPGPTQPKRPATWVEPLTGIVFVQVPKGCFEMGRKEPLPPSGMTWEDLGLRDDLATDERPQHKVCLDAYWIARHEVRRGDWRRVMATTAAVSLADDDKPMGGVSWDEAMRFIAQLNKHSSGAESFRLPTEAEWERACRAGGNDPLSPEAALRSAWFGSPFRAPLAAAPTASLAPNAWGIHDMLGNLWEWVSDSYAADAYTRHALFNPHHEDSGNRVIRGGSYRSELGKMRCTARGDYPPGETLPQIGFRLVMTRPSPRSMEAQ